MFIGGWISAKLYNQASAPESPVTGVLGPSKDNTWGFVWRSVYCARRVCGLKMKWRSGIVRLTWSLRLAWYDLDLTIDDITELVLINVVKLRRLITHANTDLEGRRPSHFDHASQKTARNCPDLTAQGLATLSVEEPAHSQGRTC